MRWRHVDLDRAQLAVVESAEKTKAGVRYKSPKNGKGRTVALPAVVVSELAHRLRQAHELLQIALYKGFGIRAQVGAVVGRDQEAVWAAAGCWRSR